MMLSIVSFRKEMVLNNLVHFQDIRIDQTSGNVGYGYDTIQKFRLDYLVVI